MTRVSPSPNMSPARTPEEIETSVGEALRALRLARDLDQAGLATQAGVSVSALKSLEGGRGSTLHTLVKVVRALGREDWLASIAPVASVSPLAMLRGAPVRLRAGRRKPATEG